MAFIEASLEELPVRADWVRVSLGGFATAGIRAHRQPTRDGNPCFQNNKLKHDFKTTTVFEKSRISKDKSRT